MTRRFFRDASIKRKLTLVIMLASSVSLLIAAACFVANDVVTLRRTMVDDLSALAKIIGANCEAPLSFSQGGLSGYEKDATATLSSLKAHPTIVAAGVYNTDGTVFAVVEGAGAAEVGDQRYPLSPHDIFVVPPWTPYRLQAGDDLVLFSYSDRAAQQALGFWKEELIADD